MRQRVWAALGLAAGVFAQGCAAGAPALGTGWLTPMDFDATAGSGADDSAAINAAIAALAKNGAHGGTLLLPPPPSGYYNICASPIVVAGNLNLRIEGAMAGSGASGGTVVRIRPDCATPPTGVLITRADYWGRLRLEDLTLDAWCLAAHDLFAERLVRGSAQNVVFRNAASGGSNVYIAAGYEDSIGHADLIENLNDYGHSCYAEASALPRYGLQMNGSDSQFDGLVVVDAEIAGFFLPNGGGSIFTGAHAWGFLSDPVSHVDLRSQWGFISYGDNFFTNWKVDNPLKGAIKLLAWGETSNGRAIVTGGYLNNTGATNTPIGVDIAPGLRDAMIIGNNFTGTTAANGVVQEGKAAATTLVYNNIGASYVAGAPWPVKYNPPLAFDDGTLTLLEAPQIRCDLTDGDCTVPAHAALVRFTQKSAVANAAVTLPEGAADGEAIQFVNYAGMVKALAFFPFVAGWRNGVSLAANTGVRIRWDAQLGNWQREQ